MRSILSFLVALAAFACTPLWAAAEPRIRLSHGDLLFERVAGQPFTATSLTVTVRTVSGSVPFRVTGLPSWLTAAPASGMATPVGTVVTLTVRQGVPDSTLVGTHSAIVAFAHRDDLVPPTLRRVRINVFGDAAAGAALFATRCRGCHLPSGGGNGPILSAIYGRPAGSFPQYVYTDALKAWGKRMDYPLLAAWLRGPQTLVPGTRMGNNVVAGLATRQRYDLIAYLRALSQQ